MTSKSVLSSSLQLLTILGLGAMPGLIQAQSEDLAAVTVTDEGSLEVASETVEQVIVTGQRSIASLIREGQRETEAFYARLNQVLDNDDFRIRCQIEYPAGSRIATHVCRMRFQEELLSRAALADVQNLASSPNGDTVYVGPGYDYSAEWIAKQREFAEEVLLAVNTDLELNQSVVRLLQLRAAVENFETPASQRRRERREAEEAIERDD